MDASAPASPRRRPRRRLALAGLALAAALLALAAMGWSLNSLLRASQNAPPPPDAAALTAAARERALDGVEAQAVADALARAHLPPGEVAADAFAAAAARLLQEPDAAGRAALIAAVAPETREEGLAALEAIAAEGGTSAGARWRAVGAIRLAAGDKQALAALREARARNPHDISTWRMMALACRLAGAEEPAIGAEEVASALNLAAERRETEAAAALEAALPRVDREGRRFVLGQLGDLAVAREDWSAAQGFYREALDAHRRARDDAARGVEAAKLARALIRAGQTDEACALLADHGVGASLPEACAADQPLGTLIRPRSTGPD